MDVCVIYLMGDGWWIAYDNEPVMHGPEDGIEVLAAWANGRPIEIDGRHIGIPEKGAARGA